MIGEHREDVSGEVANALSLVNEKKHICGLCQRGTGKCELRKAFHRDFRRNTCSSFKKREGMMW